jgi:DNA polymerase epsilon subunit 2
MAGEGMQQVSVKQNPLMQDRVY